MQQRHTVFPISHKYFFYDFVALCKIPKYIICILMNVCLSKNILIFPLKLSDFFLNQQFIFRKLNMFLKLRIGFMKMQHFFCYYLSIYRYQWIESYAKILIKHLKWFLSNIYKREYDELK